MNPAWPWVSACLDFGIELNSMGRYYMGVVGP